MSEVYAVSSGSYSDYSVHCIFESRADAIAYARALAENSLLSDHNRMVELVAAGRAAGRALVGFTSHTDPQETCEVCNSVRSGYRETDFGHVGIEPFQFYSSGTVPVVGAEYV